MVCGDAECFRRLDGVLLDFVRRRPLHCFVCRAVFSVSGPRMVSYPVRGGDPARLYLLFLGNLTEPFVKTRQTFTLCSGVNVGAVFGTILGSTHAAGA